MGATNNIIEIWLKLLEDNYEVRCGMYNKAMKEIFKQIRTPMIKALSPKQNPQKLMTDIGGGWYMEKIAKGLPPLRISILSKKAQDKEYEIEIYIYESNKWWNDWKFQSHWHNIEWVNPRSKIKRKNTYSVSSICLHK